MTRSLPLAELLEEWRDGRLSLEDLERRITEHSAPTALVAQARIDLDRVRRCGFPEVVYGAGKTAEQLLEIVRVQQESGQPSLITRCLAEHGELLAANFPSGRHDAAARTFRHGALSQQGDPRVAILTAGATDRPVSLEAAETARWMGCRVDLIEDVGVAGPWRLIERVQEFEGADAIVVVAGMEGALPSVVAGWVACPIIAVPTSVGYGASFGGVSALLSMLNCCAANVAVVNIDAGFKGGYLAGMIATRIAGERTAHTSQADS